MKFFSNCSDCIVCVCASGCLAGRYDDHFHQITQEEIDKMLETGYHERWKRTLSDQEITKIKLYLNKSVGGGNGQT